MPVSCPAGGRGRKRRLQKANAFVIYMLGEFVEACEAKQVKLSFFLSGFADFLFMCLSV